MIDISILRSVPTIDGCDFDSLRSRFSELSGMIKSLNESRNSLSKTLLSYESKVSQSKSELLVIDDALRWVNSLVKSLSDDVVDFVSSICNRVLVDIFRLPLEFKIQSSISESGVSSVKFSIVHGAKDYPIESFLGQGVYSTLSIFFSVMIAVVRDRSQFLFIDEQFGNVSTEYLSDVLDLFFEIFLRFKVTPVIISHDIRVINYLSGRVGGSHLQIKDGRFTAR